MPIYEFQCNKCDHCFEKLVFVEEDEPVQCPKCRSTQVKKLVSCASFISGVGGCAAPPGKGFS